MAPGVIFPASLEVEDGVTITIGQRTWTTGFSDITAPMRPADSPQSSWLPFPTVTVVSLNPPELHLGPLHPMVARPAVSPTESQITPPDQPLAMSPTAPAAGFPIVFSNDSPIASSIRQLFPRYNRKRISNTDLLDAIDKIDARLAETLALTEAFLAYSTNKAPDPEKRVTNADLIKIIDGASDEIQKTKSSVGVVNRRSVGQALTHHHRTIQWSW